MSPKAKLSWRMVLDCKVWVGDIDLMYKRARDLGYVYFVWNDRVYRIDQKWGAEASIFDTGMTVSDVN